MGFRCPSATPAGTGILKGYRLLFKGSKTGAYLTVEKARGFQVPVGLWKIRKEDEDALDRYEGFPFFYYKKIVVIPCTDGKRHRCMMYVMHEDRLIDVPSSTYVGTCLQGYSDFGLDPDYLFEAFEYSTKRKGYSK